MGYLHSGRCVVFKSQRKSFSGGPKLSEYLVLFDVHESNREWFEENYDALVEEFDGRFVAIYDRGVVDSDRDLDELIERVEVDFPLEKVSVEYVSRDKIQLIL
jgi:predicted DNA-binding protein (UPF0278 family)